MKKNYILFLLIFFWWACEIVGPPHSYMGDVLVTVYIHSTGHHEWTDRIQLFENNNVEINRIKGDPLPVSRRLLSDDEFGYVRSLFENFYELNDEYLDESYSSRKYEIIYHGEKGDKKVVCDASVFSHYYFGIPEYEQLRLILDAFFDFRYALIGEKMHAGNLLFSFSPEKDVVNLDQDVVLNYRVKNITNKPVTLHFANIQQLGYKVYGENNLLRRFPLAFQPATSTWTIPERGEDLKQAAWNHHIEEGTAFWDRKAKAGTYTIVQYLLDANSPYFSSAVTITEEGGEALQTRVIHNYSDPLKVTYDMNNRVSRPFTFQFQRQEYIGFRVVSDETDEIVFADTIRKEVNLTFVLTIDSFGDNTVEYVWNRRDFNNERLPSGFYDIEMWLIDQAPEYRAVRRYYYRKN